DQAGQAVARLTDKDQSNQVVVPSDRAPALAGKGAGHELWDEPAAIVVFPGLGAGSERFFGLHIAAEQQRGESGAGDEAWNHGTQYLQGVIRLTRAGRQITMPVNGLSHFGQQWYPTRPGSEKETKRKETSKRTEIKVGQWPPRNWESWFPC